jgi:hypothetical protein
MSGQYWHIDKMKLFLNPTSKKDSPRKMGKFRRSGRKAENKIYVVMWVIK